jgi:hypothetical protein
MAWLTGLMPMTAQEADSAQWHVASAVIPPAPADSVAQTGGPDRLTEKEYQWGDGPRYTIGGALPYRQTDIQPVPLAITVGTLGGMVAAIHLYQQNAWWQNQRGAFHFNTQWDYSAQADKFGHMLSGYFTAYIAHESLVASGFSHGTASWLAPTLSAAFMTYIEIEDGFARDWGFDPTDEYANLAGALLFGGQQYFPWLQNVNMKWSYWPTEQLNEGTPGHKTIIVDDYNGSMIWFSLKMANILPESIGWPKWLQLAGGYGAYNAGVVDAEGNWLQPGRKLFVALDYNLVELLPDMGSFGNWLVQTANHLHLPAPALQILPHLEFQLLYPIPL